MKKLLEEFKTFALKGNVLDMAVGVVVGGAFTSIVNSLVADVLTPIISLVTPGMDFRPGTLGPSWLATSSTPWCRLSFWPRACLPL